MPLTTKMKRSPFGVPVGGGFTLQEQATITATDVDWLPYDVRLDVKLVEGRYVCTEMTCTQKDGGDVITTNGLRAIPLGRVIAAALEDKVMKFHPIPGTKGETIGEPVGPWSSGDVKVAAIYRLAYACGLNPTSEVAAALGISKSVASNRVMAARRAGLLDPTERGRARAGGPT